MKNSFYILILSLLLSSAVKAQTYGWSELGGLHEFGPYESYSICSDAFGNTYAIGPFHAYVVKFNISTWSELGNMNLPANGDGASSCADASGNIYTAGNSTNDSGKCYVAKYDGTWSELGGLNTLAANGNINTVCSDASGNIYAAGQFTNGANATLGKCYVAKYNGTSWSELGGHNSLPINNGVGCSCSGISSICTDGSGNIYAAGSFVNSAGKYYVAKFDGTSWSELGGLNGLAANYGITSICSDLLGNIYAAGEFSMGFDNQYVAKYNGTSWSGLNQTNGYFGHISCITSDVAGNIYASTYFSHPPGNSSNSFVAKFNGTNWSELSGANVSFANGNILSLCTDTFGNIYCSGDFTDANGTYFVAKYGAITAINELSSSNSIKISPNPSGNTVNIILDNMTENAMIKLYNISGQIIMERCNVSGIQFTLDISSQPPGAYFVELRKGANVWVGKVMKVD